MAITNAQQYQQLVNPPMKGKKRPGYRGEDAYGGGTTAGGQRSGGERGDGPASRDFGGPGRDERMGMGGKKRPGRNPMAQFSPEAQKIAREMLGAKMSAGDRFVPDFFPFAKALANRFQVSKPTPFDIQKRGLIRALGPQAVDMSGKDSGGDIPTWAQLGFNSEAEYLAALQAQASSTTEQEPEEEKLEGLRLAFRAEGGSMNDQIRQAYGLGSIVKKAVGAVKKVAKSPIGKAALLYGAGSLGLAGLGKFKAGTGLSSFLQGAKVGIGNFLLGTPGDMGGRVAGTGLLSKFPGGGVGAAITAVSLLPLLGIGTGDESEEEAQAILQGQGLDIDAIRANPNQFLARRFKAEGGFMKEPVAKKTMPLLDMGGQEMDLRAEGGFVPIGRMEKADDVPARLSKNEFVFTAEAVRNAGEGDVDKGAEVMYNMMKNLEAGGDVSKESQGLEGARRMFQTSQRLEEVL